MSVSDCCSNLHLSGAPVHRVPTCINVECHYDVSRYNREEIIGGNPYAGFDRHNGEIAGFHLDG